MPHEWIQHLNTKPAVDDAPDAPTRSERYIAVVDAYWSSLKHDIQAAAGQFQQPRRTPIFVDDVGRRLLLRGDCYGLDLTLIVERELIRVRYSTLPGRPAIVPDTLDLRLDMRADYLVLLDCAGCPIDDPARFVLERFFQALVRPHTARTGRAPRW